MCDLNVVSLSGMYVVRGQTNMLWSVHGQANGHVLCVWLG